MKISFTSAEIYDWLDALRNHFCQDSEEAVEKYDMMVRKFKNAESRSRAGIYKIRYARNAQDKKLRTRDAEVRASMIEAFRDDRNETKEKSHDRQRD